MFSLLFSLSLFSSNFSHSKMPWHKNFMKIVKFCHFFFISNNNIVLFSWCELDLKWSEKVCKNFENWYLQIEIEREKWKIDWGRQVRQPGISLIGLTINKNISFFFFILSLEWLFVVWQFSIHFLKQVSNIILNRGGGDLCD